MSKYEHEVHLKASLTPPAGTVKKIFVRAGALLWDFRIGDWRIFWSGSAQPLGEGGLLPRFPRRWRYTRVEYMLGLLAIAALAGCTEATKPVVYDWDCNSCPPGTYCPQTCNGGPR